MKLRILSLSSLLLTAALSIGAYYTADFWRDFALMLAGAFFSLGIGLYLANVYLSHDERARAAAPLLAMIDPDIAKFHNEYFIKPGRLAFGTPGFNAAIGAYEKNGRKPESLSPEQRDKFYEIIIQNKDAILPLLDRIHSSLAEVSAILGWSFSPSVMRIVLDARVTLTRFKALSFGGSIDEKLKACKGFIDLDAVLAAIVAELNQILGRKNFTSE